MITSTANSPGTPPTASERARYLIYLTFLVVCLLGGGGSRGDIISLLYVRPAAILSLASILALPGPMNFRLVRVPFWLLVALTLLIVAQLLPLPPQIWTALPGRSIVVDGAIVMGMDQSWRPLTLSPDHTYNSLAAMTVPFAALLGFAALSPRHRDSLTPFLIAAGAASATLAVLQLSAGPDSLLYSYSITNRGSAVGLFANRNHQAMMLALTLPMLAVWASCARGDHQRRMIIRWSALAVGFILLAMLLVTGSRAGLMLGGSATIWSIFQFMLLRRAKGGGAPRIGIALIVAFAGAALAGSILAYLTFGQAESLQRLIGNDLLGERRMQHLPVLVELGRYYFPLGTGFGSFDPVYRIHEPMESLSPGYLNHAHNDFLELAITGGAPALLILLTFTMWWFGRTWAAVRSRSNLALLGGVVILILLVGSLVDYPLRTPILMAVFAIACGWLGSAGAEPLQRDEAASIALRSV